VENSGQPWWFDFFIDFSMKTLTLLWTFLLALQSNRSAEFSILHSPALIPKFPQSPSSSYLFSHLSFVHYPVVHAIGYRGKIVNVEKVSIALKLLPVFTLFFFRKFNGLLSLVLKVAIALRLLPVFTRCKIFWLLGSSAIRGIVAIALRLLPVFTQLLFLMQKTCAFLNPKILTSLSNPF